MNKSLVFLLLLFFRIEINATGQSFVQNIHPDTEVLLESTLLQNIGYPFQKKEFLLSSSEIYFIAEHINNLSKQNDFNSKDQRKPFFQHQYNLISDNSNIMKSYSIENYGAFAESSTVNPNEILSTLILAGHYGDIENIEPFLKYSLIYIGQHKDAYDDPMFTFSFGEHLAEVNLTKEQRLCHWPAANAIIKNSTVSIPLLVDYIIDPQNNELLRYRAIGFLQDLAPELLEEEVLPKVRQEMVTHIKCILAGNFTWREASSQACDMLLKHQMKRERLMPIRQKLAKDIERREQENQKSN